MTIKELAEWCASQDPDADAQIWDHGGWFELHEDKIRARDLIQRVNDRERER